MADIYPLGCAVWGSAVAESLTVSSRLVVSPSLVVFVVVLIRLPPGGGPVSLYLAHSYGGGARKRWTGTELMMGAEIDRQA